MIRLMQIEAAELVTKRQALLITLTSSASLISSVSPSHAFLGIGEDNVQDQYVKSTVSIWVEDNNLLASILFG
jgi:hypothetical protein